MSTIYRNMKTTQESFHTFLSQDLISGINEILDSFHTQKKKKVYFFAESHLDFLFLIQGGNFQKRGMELYETLKNKNLPLETCIFIYLLFSEKKVGSYLFDSNRKTLFPIVCGEEELNLGSNPYGFFLAYLQKSLEEAHEISKLNHWTELNDWVPSV